MGILRLTMLSGNFAPLFLLILKWQPYFCVNCYETSKIFNVEFPKFSKTHFLNKPNKQWRPRPELNWFLRMIFSQLGKFTVFNDFYNYEEPKICITLAVYDAQL